MRVVNGYTIEVVSTSVGEDMWRCAVTIQRPDGSLVRKDEMTPYHDKVVLEGAAIAFATAVAGDLPPA